MGDAISTMKVSPVVKKKLSALARKSITYNDVIEKLILYYENKSGRVIPVDE